VIAPVAGWLEQTTRGRTVRAGETVGVIYSLEVYATTSDLISQLRDFRSQAAVDEQRERLYRWGMRREMVAAIEQTGKPQASLPLISRVSGTVVARKKLETPLVERGDDLLTVSAPGFAWLYVDVPVDDAALVRVGMTGRVKIDGIAHPMTAPITYVSRRVTDGTRTLRFDLHTAELRLPPTGQAKVELELGTMRGSAIPETAVVRDGERAFVYFAGTTRMEPREVTLGPSTEGWYLVTRGLAVGDRIAVDANHLAQRR
jgi:multidrug efflux pump subunit AcrA (membrane-fusion protein)